MPGEKFKEIHIKKETMRSYNDQFVGQIGNPSGGFDHKPEKSRQLYGVLLPSSQPTGVNAFNTVLTAAAGELEIV